jgi:type II secretory pathway component PulF
MKASALSFSVRWAAYQFKSKRLEYYTNLADRIEAADGKKNFLDFFTADAQRYAGKSRGVLSEHWVVRMQDTGADLANTFSGTLPEEEVMLIRVAQQSGKAGILTALRDLARVGQTIQEAKNEFVSTMVAAFFGALIACAALAAIPFFSVPKLTETFSMLPQDKWGPVGQTMLSISDFLKSWGIFLFVGLIGLGVWIVWSLTNWTGTTRQWCDRHVLIYKLYRDFRGALFMATLASMTKHQGNSLSLIRNSLLLLGQQSSPWLSWHITQIVAFIDETGKTTADAFNTGILEEETLYFFIEVFETRGFDVGMQEAGRRTERMAKVVVTKRATVLRWATLGSALVTVMYIAGLHYRFVFEIKGLMQSALT